MPADADEVPKVSVALVPPQWDGIGVMVLTCQRGPGDALNNSCGQCGPQGLLVKHEHKFIFSHHHHSYVLDAGSAFS